MANSSLIVTLFLFLPRPNCLSHPCIVAHIDDFKYVSNSLYLFICSTLTFELNITFILATSGSPSKYFLHKK